MRKMAGILGLALLILVLTPGSSEALWPSKAEDHNKPSAAESAKGAAKEAFRDTADAAKNAGESIKQTANAAYETTANAAKTVTGGKEDATSNGAPGAVYRDSAGRYVEDTVSTARGRASDAAGAVKDAASRAAGTVTGRSQDAAPTYSTQGKASDAAGTVKDAAARASQNIQDTLNAAGEKASQAASATKDAAVGAGQSVRDGAARAYDSTTSTLGAPAKDRGVYDKAGDYYQGAKDSVNNAAYRTGDAVSRASQATRDTTANAYNSAARSVGYEAPAEKGYGTRAYDTARDASSDAYEGVKGKLGSIIEILGWHRAPEDDSATRNFSPYDVVVGNTRYVWHQRPDSYYQSAKDTVGGAAQATSEKVSQLTNNVYDAAGRTKDRAVDAASWATNGVKDATWRAKDSAADTANWATESVKGVTGQTSKSASDYSQKGKEALGAGAAAVGLNRMGGVMESKGGIFSRILRFVYLLAYAVTFGSAVWMTFISGALLSRSIPREQFRNVQTKMFPYFLKFLTAGEAALTLLYSLMRNSSRWQILNLLVLLASTAYNAFVLEPKTTKVYLERLRLEKEEGRGLNTDDNTNNKLTEKKKKIDEMHGFSTVLNVLNLLGLAYHAWRLIPTMCA